MKIGVPAEMRAGETRGAASVLIGMLNPSNTALPK